jgi:hypothetical protein
MSDTNIDHNKQSSGRQFSGRRKTVDVFLDALDPCSSDMTLAMSELQAVKRAIACVYLAIPLGAVLMATGVLVCVCVWGGVRVFRCLRIFI